MVTEYQARIERNRQEKILLLLRIIDDHIRETGESPTFRDIADALGYKSLCQPRNFIFLAQKRGYVRYRLRTARTLQLTDLGRAVLGEPPPESPQSFAKAA
jgi:SOS-response transcriptional repressor LexA